MTEKVKITQKQAEAIKQLKCMGLNEESILLRIVHVKNAESKEVFGKWSETLSAMNLGTLIKALYIGYEVEKTFEVGDWLVRIVDNGRNHELGKIFRADKIADDCVYDEEGTQHLKSSCRHATPEEISEGKQRRWWARHNREVWELKEGDVLEGSGCLHTVECFNPEYVWLRDSWHSEQIEKLVFDLVKRYFEVFCFAEDRKDLE